LTREKQETSLDARERTPARGRGSNTQQTQQTRVS
jgi:hypothetical protein